MRKTKSAAAKIMAASIAFSMVFSNAPVAMAATSGVSSVKVTNVKKNTITLNKGKSFTLKTSVLGKGKFSKAVTFKTSNKKVATVTSKGKISAKKNGTAKITVTSKANKKKKAVVTVKVVTPVKKVKLNKTKASVAVGNTLTLKATLSPSKASNKKVAWKSSDKKIATVTSKGVVKGIKAGTVKITATAKDGSKKKATATITVKKKINVSSVTVKDPITVQLKLDGAQKLSASNMTAKIKKAGTSSYSKTAKIVSITSSDNTTYTIKLDSPLENKDAVSLTVKGLLGNSSVTKAATYDLGTFEYTQNLTYTYCEGDEVNEVIPFEGAGKSTYTVSGLPSGIGHQNVDDNCVKLSGIINEQGKMNSTVTIKDAVGNKYIYKITWAVGGVNSISASAEPYTTCVTSEGYAIISTNISAVGGSGSYVYSLRENFKGISIDASTGEVAGTIAKTGTYTVKVKVTDSRNDRLTTNVDLTIKVVASVSITGKVTDADGNGIDNAEVYVTDVKSASDTPTYMTYTDANGEYIIDVVAGSYNIKAHNSGVNKVVYGKNVKADTKGVNFKLDLYRVYIKADSSSTAVTSYDVWTDTNGNYIGSGNELFLKSGTYNLRTETTIDKTKYIIESKFTISGKAITATAKIVKEESTIKNTLKVGDVIDIEADNEPIYYTFTPSKSGIYYFYTTGTADTYGSLEDADENQYVSGDNVGDDVNFCISYDCEAGVTYYLYILKYEKETELFTLTVSNTAP